MDKSIKKSLPVWRETRFRQPGPIERELGLWVDRIGAGASRSAPIERLRILGQYAAVAVLSGAGRFIGEGGRQECLAAGDVLLVLPEEPLAYGPGTAWFTCWVVWNGPEANAVAKLSAFAEFAPVLAKSAAIVERAFHDLRRCMDDEGIAGALERKVILLRMVHELLARRSVLAADRHGLAIKTVIDYLRGHLAEQLSLPMLARRAHLSVPHFRRLFKAHTGCSPNAFIAAQRIARAKELLLQGLSIKQTANQVGYGDELYFRRVFRKVAGETPGRFARNGLISCRLRKSSK